MNKCKVENIVSMTNSFDEQFIEVACGPNIAASFNVSTNRVKLSLYFEIFSVEQIFIAGNGTLPIMKLTIAGRASSKCLEPHKYTKTLIE